MKQFSKRIVAALALAGGLNAIAMEPKFVFEEDPTLLITNVRVVVMSGSTSDPGGKNGLMNMMGEMILRGTKKKSREKFQSELEKLGASLSAYTSHDALVFQGAVIKENTDKFLALLEETLLNPSLPKTELEPLREEIIGEILHMKNQNNRLGGLVLRREAFAGTPLAKPVGGSLSTVKAIKHEDIVRAYNNAFHRGNVIFGVSSSKKEADMKKALTGMWLKLPDGARQAAKNIPPKTPKKPTLIVVHKPKTSTGSILFAQPGILAKDPDRYALNVANFSFGGEPLVSRLFRIIRSKEGWTYAVYSTYSALGSLSNQQGFYAIVSTPTVEFTSKTIFKTVEMWNEYLKSGLTKDELNLAQESIVNSYPFEFDSAQKRVSEKLNSYLYDVPILTPEEFDKKINGISNDEIKKALKARHQNGNWLMVLVADKDVVTKQLEEFQKDLPKEKRIEISATYTPDQVIE